jgi:hypothetical protein
MRTVYGRSGSAPRGTAAPDSPRARRPAAIARILPALAEHLRTLRGRPLRGKRTSGHRNADLFPDHVQVYCFKDAFTHRMRRRAVAPSSPHPIPLPRRLAGSIRRRPLPGEGRFSHGVWGELLSPHTPCLPPPLNLGSLAIMSAAYRDGEVDKVEDGYPTTCSSCLPGSRFPTSQPPSCHATQGFILELPRRDARKWHRRACRA